MLNNNRILWVDGMKGFSAIAVMLYHSSTHSQVSTISYMLCLPAFFFVAGVFSNTHLTPSQFFRHKTLRLLIPYLVFGVLCWILWLVIGRKVGHDADSNISWWFPLWGLICGKIEFLIQNPPLWFLCCMICTEWLYYILSRVPYQTVRWFGGCLIAILGCVLSLFGKTAVWEITAAMLVLPLYILGAECNVFFVRIFTKYNYVTLFIILLITLVGIGIGYWFNPEFHISNCIIGNPLLFYITAFCVLGFWLAFTNIIDKSIGISRWLSYFGQNTLIVLCTHIPLFGAIKGICMIFGVPLTFFETNIGSIVLWISAIVLSFPLICVINRFFPFLIGKRKQTTP